MNTNIMKVKKDAYDNQENILIPPVDIYETADEYVIKADMPGIEKENIDIILDNNLLEIKGIVPGSEKNSENLKYSEYSLLNYHRSFNVGNDIDNNKISAKMEDGVLTLTIPKKEEIKPKKIQINISN